MRSFKLRINVLLIIAVISPILLWFTNPGAFPSISQYAKSTYEIFLDMYLISIALIFWEIASNWQYEGLTAFKLKKLNIRYRHLDRFIAIFFFAILLTDVIEPYLEISHFIMTGMGIGLVFLRMILEKIKIVKILALVGVVGFLIGFLTPLYNTFLGEYIFTIAALSYIYPLNRKEIG
jgi:hypothetical protein